MTTKSDFTLSGGILFVVGMGIFMLVIVNLFLQSSMLNSLISLAFAVLFGIYLIYDT